MWWDSILLSEVVHVYKAHETDFKSYLCGTISCF